MKKTIYYLCIIFSCAFTFAACSSKQKSNEAEMHKEAMKYQCPMKCEGDKTYTEKGKCPECGMDMEEVKDEKEGEYDDD